MNPFNDHDNDKFLKNVYMIGCLSVTLYAAFWGFMAYLLYRIVMHLVSL